MRSRHLIIPVALLLAILAGVLSKRAAHSVAKPEQPSAKVPVIEDALKVTENESSPSFQRQVSSPVPSVPQSNPVADCYWHLLEKFIAARKEFGPAGIPGKRSSFAIDLASGLLQARLLALTSPSDVESLALGIVKDPSASTENVLFATRILATLLSQGSTQAGEALRTLTHGTDTEIVPAALEALLANDKDGKNISLYWQVCSRNVLNAFAYGPLWKDDQMKQGLQSRAAQYAALKQSDYYSEEALERLSILEAAKGAETLEALVRGPDDSGQIEGWSLGREDWALQVIQLHPTAGTIKVLRDRLVKAENGGRIIVANGGQVPPSTDPSFPSWADKNYDRVLVTYFNLGGKLNDVETARLTYFGYLGDPKERLQALLALK